MAKENDKKYMDYLMSIPKETYIKILENCASDVYVTDKNRKIIYVNPNSIRHYGVHPEDMVGVNSDEFRKGKWAPSALDLCMKEKRTVFAEQNYLLIGKSVSTVLTPICDKNGDIEMVVSIANEIPSSFDTTWRKEGNDNNAFKKSKRHDTYLRDDIVGVSYMFYKMLNTIQKVSKSDVPILLTGESGVGKTLIAEYVHNTSTVIEKMAPSLPLTVQPFRKTCWSRSFSVTNPIHLPVQALKAKKVCWSWPMAALYF